MGKAGLGRHFLPESEVVTIVIVYFMQHTKYFWKNIKKDGLVHATLCDGPLKQVER
jgi:hypothetical protein